MTAAEGPPSPVALLVIDVQQGFEDSAWGPRNNPDCEANIRLLISEWRRRGEPVIFVRHDSANGSSPLAPGQLGNSFKTVISGEPDLLVTKRVHSAFYGAPDLDAWLQHRGIISLAICGIATDHCCETTARMAGDLGYHTCFVLDATHAFDRSLPDGSSVSADQIYRATAASLHGEFASVVSTREMLAD